MVMNFLSLAIHPSEHCHTRPDLSMLGAYAAKSVNHARYAPLFASRRRPLAAPVSFCSPSLTVAAAAPRPLHTQAPAALHVRRCSESAPVCPPSPSKPMRPPTPSFLLIKKPSPRPCDIDRLDGGLAVSSSDSTLATRRHTCLPSSSSFTLQKRLKFPGRRGGTSLAGIETPLLHGRVPLLRRAVRETKVRLMAYHFGLMRRSAVGLPPVRDRAGEGSALDGRKICSR
jgi:hypothetical protein